MPLSGGAPSRSAPNECLERTARSPSFPSYCNSIVPLSISRHTEAPSGWSELADRSGLFYHSSAWINGISECFRFPVHWLSARDGQQLRGGLALAQVPGLLGGSRLVSFPFGYAAGPL